MSRMILSCDWGTTRFRLSLVETPPTRVVRTASSEAGVGRTGSEALPRGDALRTFLQREVARILDGVRVRDDEVPLWISGMASSSIGWVELPYARVPFPLDGSEAVVRDLGPLGPGHPHPVRLVSGLQTARDVMRGEETQLLGLFSSTLRAGLLERSVVILPGTHSKHVTVEQHRIVDFRTFLTGELFHVLRHHSVLRHSMTSALANEDVVPEPSPSFLEGVRESRAVPLLGSLFQVRTRQLLGGEGPDAGSAFLSGLLIGAELAALNEGVSSPSPPVLIACAAPLADLYRAAMDAWEWDGAVDVTGRKELEESVARGHLRLQGTP